MSNRDDKDKPIQTAEEIKREQELLDIQQLMESAVGKRFLSRLVFEMTHVHSLSYTGNAETHFREGRRSVGLHVMAEMLEAVGPDFINQLDMTRAIGGNEQ